MASFVHAEDDPGPRVRPAELLSGRLDHLRPVAAPARGTVRERQHRRPAAAGTGVVAEVAAVLDETGRPAHTLQLPGRPVGPAALP